MCNSAAHNSRPNRESLSKKLGVVTARGIAARDHGQCQYCLRTEIESGAHLQLDHLVTRSAGGADVATNLVLACRRCNSARQNLTLSAWARKAATLGLVVSPRAIRAQARRPLPTVARAA